ncbi:MAG: hypothetical protein QXR60_00925 [Candidatus Nanoarchaeia archaeon]
MTEKLDEIISKLADSMGVSKADYIKSLILKDLRNSGTKMRRDKE